MLHPKGTKLKMTALLLVVVCYSAASTSMINLDRPTKYEVFSFKRELIRCQDRKGEPRSTKRDRLMQLGSLKVIGNGNIR